MNQKPASTSEILKTSGVETLQKLGYTGSGIKVIGIGSDFTGADNLISKAHPKSRRLRAPSPNPFGLCGSRFFFSVNRNSSARQRRRDNFPGDAFPIDRSHNPVERAYKAKRHGSQRVSSGIRGPARRGPPNTPRGAA